MADPTKVLIIDDSPLTLESLRISMTARGFDVRTAPNGKEGLARIQEATPDVILMDVVMPVMDGWETCRQIRAAANLRAVPVIIMTHRNTPQSLLKAFEVGANDFLEKPIDPDALKITLEGLTRRPAQGGTRSHDA